MNFQKKREKPKHEKYHNKAVRKLSEHPSRLGLDIKNPKSKLVKKPIISPRHVYKEATETGDLIFILSFQKEKKWSIIVIEVITGIKKTKLRWAKIKIHYFFDYFQRYGKIFLKKENLSLPSGFELWIKGLVADYYPVFLHENPKIIKVKKKRII